MKTLKRSLAAGSAAAWLAAAPPQIEFDRIADHCFFASLGGGGVNVGAIVTREGILLIDPPAEQDLQAVLEALRSLSPHPVRWVVCTSHRRLQSSGYSYLAEQGAVFIGSKSLDRLAFPSAAAPAGTISSEGVAKSEVTKNAVPSNSLRFVFEGRLRLFPDDVEVHITAVRLPAVTGGDVIVCVPDEKVLYTGDLFAPGAFPEIDIPGGGSALGWLDAMKQSIGAVPMLRPAVVRTQPELPPALPELERSPEENILVVPGRGAASNLKQMKELLEAAQKLRTQAARAAAMKRPLQGFLASGGLDEFRRIANFESFAGCLLEALAAGTGRRPRSYGKPPGGPKAGSRV